MMGGKTALASSTLRYCTNEYVWLLLTQYRYSTSIDWGGPYGPPICRLHSSAWFTGNSGQRPGSAMVDGRRSVPILCNRRSGSPARTVPFLRSEAGRKAQDGRRLPACASECLLSAAWGGSARSLLLPSPFPPLCLPWAHNTLLCCVCCVPAAKRVRPDQGTRPVRHGDQPSRRNPSDDQGP